jgi:hypothetical protein
MSINRRNFIGDSFACLASLPLIANGKVKPSNIRYDVAEKTAELFINNLDSKCDITSLNSLELYTQEISYTEKLNNLFKPPKNPLCVSIDGFGIKGSVEIPTNINWLDSLNVSPFKVIDLIINKLITDYNFRLDRDFFIPEKRTRGINHKIFGMNLINKNNKMEKK